MFIPKIFTKTNKRTNTHIHKPPHPTIRFYRFWREKNNDVKEKHQLLASCMCLNGESN